MNDPNAPYLTLLETLAAHVLVPEDYARTIVKRLLVFLTSGERGFNRALFLVFNEEDTTLRYSAGRGSLGYGPLTAVVPHTEKDGNANIFEDMALTNGPDLNVVMRGFEFDATDSTAKTLLQEFSLGEFSPSEIATWPTWLRVLAGRIKSNSVLATSVRIEATIYGLLVVDRPSLQPFSEADKEALRTSARLAAFILRKPFINPRLIRVDPSPLPLKIRTVTICFWDVRGFSNLCDKLERSPNLIADFLNEYYDAATVSIEEHNGVIDKFMGDGIMALFGINSDEDDDKVDPGNGAIDAVCAAVALRRKFDSITRKRISTWRKNVAKEVITIGLGCGIHTGKALVGTVGSGLSAQSTALGTDVNFTSRIEKRSKGGQIIVSQPTKEWVSSIVTCSRGKILDDISGLEGRYPVFVVKAVNASGRK